MTLSDGHSTFVLLKQEHIRMRNENIDRSYQKLKNKKKYSKAKIIIINLFKIANSL